MFDASFLTLAQVPGSTGGDAPGSVPGSTPAPGTPAPAGVPGGGNTTQQVPGGGSTPLGGQQGGGQQGGGLAGALPYVFLLGVIVLMFVMTSWTSRKEKKKRASMLESIKKGDRVQTIGGVLGQVVEVKENEVVVKVDPNTNARMTFVKSAIQGVVEQGDEEAAK